jgi:hypothetical protein
MMGVARAGAGNLPSILSASSDESISTFMGATALLQTGMGTNQQLQPLQKAGGGKPTPEQIRKRKKAECCMHDAAGSALGGATAGIIGTIVACKAACLGGPVACIGCVIAGLGISFIIAVGAFIIAFWQCYNNPYKCNDNPVRNGGKPKPGVNWYVAEDAI